MANVVIAGVIAFTIARGMSAGTNIDKREKYWEKEISGSRNIPMRLAVIFAMKGDKVVSHQFATTAIEQ